MKRSILVCGIVSLLSLFGPSAFADAFKIQCESLGTMKQLNLSISESGKADLTIYTFTEEGDELSKKATEGRVTSNREDQISIRFLSDGPGPSKFRMAWIRSQEAQKYSRSSRIAYQYVGELNGEKLYCARVEEFQYLGN